MNFKNYARNFFGLTLAALLSCNTVSYSQINETQKNKSQLLRECILESNQQPGQNEAELVARMNKLVVGDFLFDLSVNENSLKINYLNKFVEYLVEEDGLLVDKDFNGIVDEGFSNKIKKNFYPGEILSEEKTQFSEENKNYFQQKFDEIVNTLLAVYERRKTVNFVNSNVSPKIAEKAKRVARIVKVLGEDNGWSCDFSFEKEGKEYTIKVFDFSVPQITLYELPFDNFFRDELVLTTVATTDRRLDGLSDAGRDFAKNQDEEYKRVKNFNEFRNEGLEYKEFFQTEYERLLSIMINRFAAMKLTDVNLCKLAK